MDSGQVLSDAYRLIRSGWTRDFLAIDKSKKSVDPCGTKVVIYDKSGKVISEHIREAVAWSISGAILAAEGSNHFFQTDAHKVVFELVESSKYNYISDWEDAKGRTHDDVKHLLAFATDRVRKMR